MKRHHQILIVLSAILVLCSCQLTRNRSIDQKNRRLPTECGMRDSKYPVESDVKIINGRNASLGAFPWMAALVYHRPNTSERSWGCAGSLITDQYIITAAHCAIPSLTGGLVLYSARLGDLNLDNSVDDGASPIDVLIEEVIPHERYDNVRKVNDIALIKLKTKVQFTDLIKPICLPPTEFTTNMFVGYSPTIAGWGKSNKSKEARPGTMLLEAEVRIQEMDSCRRNVTSKLKDVIVDQTMICAGSDAQDNRPIYDSCQGDSGGPMMFYHKKKDAPPLSKGRMHLMGIVSYGYNCAQEGYPGVYTRVSQHMLWIMNHLDI